MPLLHRIIHFFMAICYVVTASCAAHIATTATAGTSVLLWILTVPVIATAAHGFRMTFGRAAEM